MARGRDSRDLAAVHERFLAMPTTPLPEQLVRPVVAESWRRSLAHGVDPTAEFAPLDLSESQLAEYRANHPLAPMMPLIRRLLTDDADEAGHIVAIGDERGRLLWVEGQHRLRSKAEAMHFVEGALWSERGAGTNAPGTALALERAVQIKGEEHFGLGVQSWSCVAAPVHDPVTGRLLGVIDLTGGPDVAGPRTLGLVRACAAAVEAGLALRIPGPRVTPSSMNETLTLMGPDAGLLTLGGRQFRLSRRHTELVWLLADAPQGLTAQALDAALHPDGRNLITVRAEINRLRRALGSERLESRPYRLTFPITTDVADVRARLRAGRVRDALDAFPGEPLPGSDAPGVRELTTEFVGELRQAVVDSGDPAALEQWTALPAGHDDAEAWQKLALVSPLGSPRRAQARAHLHRLA